MCILYLSVVTFTKIMHNTSCHTTARKYVQMYLSRYRIYACLHLYAKRFTSCMPPCNAYQWFRDSSVSPNPRDLMLKSVPKSGPKSGAKSVYLSYPSIYHHYLSLLIYLLTYLSTYLSIDLGLFGFTMGLWLNDLTTSPWQARLDDGIAGDIPCPDCGKAICEEDLARILAQQNLPFPQAELFGF